MRGRKTFLVASISALVSLSPAELSSQAAGVPENGARVRVQTVDKQRWRTGYLKMIDSLTVVIDDPSNREVVNGILVGPAPSFTIPTSSLTSFERSTGRHRTAARILGGTILGAVGGAIALGAIGYAVTRCNDCEESGIGALAGLFLGVPIGAVFGALAGAQAPERWVRASIPGR